VSSVLKPNKTSLRPPETVIGRKVDVPAGTNSGKPPPKRLKKSLELQERMRRLTHQVLAAQETERGQLSRKLQNDLAQTLLGLNVRLLLLRQAARNKAKGLKNEIASAQRVVVKSAKSVRKLARELDTHRPTPGELRVMAT
jgi:signal transduction histidine kinase